MQNTSTRLGLQDASSTSSDYNTLKFIIERVVNRLSTSTLVQIKAITNTPGQITTVGQVDVLPLVNQLDGGGNATKHEVIHGLPYFRYQGGANAVLCDPKIGDIGLAIFADRDISSVKTNKAQANPGSRRRFDMADGVYIGLCLAAAPTQYIAFTDDGINIIDKNGNKIEMSSSGIKITGVVECVNEVRGDAEVIAHYGGMGLGSNVHLSTHEHSDVQVGDGQSGPPVSGS